MTRTKKARIDELNSCRAMLNGEVERVRGTDKANLVPGLTRAVAILMNHKQAISPVTSGPYHGPSSLTFEEMRAHAARMGGK